MSVCRLFGSAVNAAYEVVNCGKRTFARIGSAGAQGVQRARDYCPEALGTVAVGSAAQAAFTVCSIMRVLLSWGDELDLVVLGGAATIGAVLGSSQTARDFVENKVTRGMEFIEFLIANRPRNVSPREFFLQTGAHIVGAGQRGVRFLQWRLEPVLPVARVGLQTAVGMAQNGIESSANVAIYLGSGTVEAGRTGVRVAAPYVRDGISYSAKGALELSRHAIQGGISGAEMAAPYVRDGIVYSTQRAIDLSRGAIQEREEAEHAAHVQVNLNPRAIPHNAEMAPDIRDRVMHFTHAAVDVSRQAIERGVGGVEMVSPYVRDGAIYSVEGAVNLSHQVIQRGMNGAEKVAPYVRDGIVYSAQRVMDLSRGPQEEMRVPQEAALNHPIEEERNDAALAAPIRGAAAHFAERTMDLSRRIVQVGMNSASVVIPGLSNRGLVFLRAFVDLGGTMLQAAMPEERMRRIVVAGGQLQERLHNEVRWIRPLMRQVLAEIGVMTAEMTAFMEREYPATLGMSFSVGLLYTAYCVESVFALARFS